MIREKSMTRDEALISMMLLTNMRGEFIGNRYLYRLLTPVPDEEKGNRLIEFVDGVPYTEKPRELMKALIKYPPYKQEYERYERMYVMPEEPINLVYRAEDRVWISTYFVDFGKDVKVVGMQMHGDRDAEYHIIENGERYLIYIHKYDIRPPWRGLKWKEENVADVPMDLIHRATAVFNRSYEVFPPRIILVKGITIPKEERAKRGYSRVNIYRVFDYNPVLDVDRSGFIVEYKKRTVRVGLERISDAKTVEELLGKIGLRKRKEKGGMNLDR